MSAKVKNPSVYKCRSRSHKLTKRVVKTQHLVTNLQYKVNPYGKKTKFLRARIDTCSNANMMPANIYKILYNDPDCTKLLPSKKNGHKNLYQTEDTSDWIF